MSLRARQLLPVLVLGAALAVIPAIAVSASAGSSSATVVGTEADMWSPMEVAITPGGTVTFQDTSSSVPHGVVWTTVPETPKCTGVPINEGKTNWQGACTFEQEGVYQYYCYVHGTYMSGKIFVNAAGALPGGSTTTTTTTTSMTMSSTSSSYPSPPSTGSTGKEPGTSSPDSLGGGSLQLAAHQRGGHIRGSVQVAKGGSTLAMAAFATKAQLEAGARRGRVRVARLSRLLPYGGRASFSMALDARALHALRKRGHLRLEVRLRLSGPDGEHATRTVTVVVHARK